MKVSDILRVKGGTLFTVTPGETLSAALDVMSHHDIGSLVVMELGDVVGMLTFREVIQAIQTPRNQQQVVAALEREVGNDADEVRVAAAFADAVDRALHLRGALVDGG